DLVGFSAQGPQVFAVGAHDDGFLPAGEHLGDPLVQVRLHLAEQARVSVRDRVDAVEGGLVVRPGREADPDLPQVDAGHFLAEQRLTDVGANALYAGDGQQLTADPGRGAFHLRTGRAGR